MKKKRSRFTNSVHSGEEPGNFEGAVSTPVFRSSLFAFEDADTGAAIHNFEKPGYFYSRLGNPTQAALESAIADLEHGEAAVATASGMAAISSSVLAFCETGDHIVALESMYSTSSSFFDFLGKKFGIEVSRVDGRDSESYENALRENTRLIWVETPSNPMLNVSDLKSIGEMSQKTGILSIADNTFATPFNQTPLDYGIDIVVHSATKYLGGHSDVTAGLIVSTEDKIELINHSTVEYLGAGIAPDVAWLTLRGIKTLAVRMDKHNSNASALADMLSSDSRVRAVNYPGLADHQGHNTASTQMNGYGGIVSFDLGTFEAARSFMNGLEMTAIATSLGGVESIAQHSAAMTHAKLTPAQRASAGISEGLIRFSVGIEGFEDIAADVSKALDNTNDI